MMVCLGIQKKGTRLLRSGVYLFTIMEWVSAVGFGMFPLSDSGYAGTFQDQMHILSTVIVVLLSIISLILIIISGIKTEAVVPMGICRNSTWNDDGWCIRYEHCSERVFWNSREVQCFCSNRFSGGFGNAPL